MPIEFIPAICPKCGGELRVPKNRDTIRCMYCGVDIILNKENNSNQPSAENYLRLADAALNNNWNEAYRYYTKALEIEPQNWKAWYGKAISAGCLSTTTTPRLTEMLNNVQNAMTYCPEEEKRTLCLRIGQNFEEITGNVFDFCWDYHTKHKFAYTYNQLSDLCMQIFDVIRFVIKTSPDQHQNAVFVNRGMDYCNLMMEIAPISSFKNLYSRLNQDFSNLWDQIVQLPDA